MVDYVREGHEDLELVENVFVSTLKAFGGKAGNISMKAALNWEDKDFYNMIKERLVNKGVIVKSRGKGGSVKLIEPLELTEVVEEVSLMNHVERK